MNRADREVQQLTESFNQMVSQLVQRLERDARFASDVSHELRLLAHHACWPRPPRSLKQHRENLRTAGQESLDLLSPTCSIFQSLVEDLLEMSRSDAGAVPLVMETLSAIELVQSIRSIGIAMRHEAPSSCASRSPKESAILSYWSTVAASNG